MGQRGLMPLAVLIWLAGLGCRSSIVETPLEHACSKNGVPSALEIGALDPRLPRLRGNVVAYVSQPQGGSQEPALRVFDLGTRSILWEDHDPNSDGRAFTELAILDRTLYVSDWIEKYNAEQIYWSQLAAIDLDARRRAVLERRDDIGPTGAIGLSVDPLAKTILFARTDNQVVSRDADGKLSTVWPEALAGLVKLEVKHAGRDLLVQHFVEGDGSPRHIDVELFETGAQRRTLLATSRFDEPDGYFAELHISPDYIFWTHRRETQEHIHHAIDRRTGDRFEIPLPASASWGDWVCGANDKTTGGLYNLRTNEYRAIPGLLECALDGGRVVYTTWSGSLYCLDFE